MIRGQLGDLSLLATHHGAGEAGAIAECEQLRDRRRMVGVEHAASL